jgi:hypothetical protein
MLHDTAVVQYKTLDNKYGRVQYELFIPEDTIPAVTLSDLQMVICSLGVIRWQIEIQGNLGPSPQGNGCYLDQSIIARDWPSMCRKYTICCLTYKYMNSGVSSNGQLVFRLLR